jgi:EamA domain-containing membrane protein RarD
MKTKISSLAPIVAVSFLFAFSANKKIQVDSGTSLVLETDFSASKKKKHQPFDWCL